MGFIRSIKAIIVNPNGMTKEFIDPIGSKYSLCFLYSLLISPNLRSILEKIHAFFS